MTDHTHADLAHKGDPSLDRLLFFSDGVFAIAITLLAIELHVPHGWDGTAATLLREGWPMLAAFVLSFGVVGIFWNTHRRLFLGMERFTMGVFVLNLAVLAGIALMPFATVLMYSPPVTPETFAIYLGLVSAIGLFNGMTYGYAAFVADVVRPRLHPMRRLSVMLMQTLMPGACCGASLALFSNTPVWITGGLALIAVGLTAFIIWTKRRYA
ncbi:putative membrane protein [Brevundimonas alba]|uniref:Putative membrane protein n=1 Tax=Brevundimonas alba TaxID=74314 RepID=A0A7X6BPP4_9CAUL|nr:TMEM175 family protein [Brevundimonas alba]NJC42184.1 putative membrane protein [Brevundimonas alba]